jgi:hypothetical protein
MKAGGVEGMASRAARGTPRIAPQWLELY